MWKKPRCWLGPHDQSLPPCHGCCILRKPGPDHTLAAANFFLPLRRHSQKTKRKILISGCARRVRGRHLPPYFLLLLLIKWNSFAKLTCWIVQVPLVWNLVLFHFLSVAEWTGNEMSTIPEWIAFMHVDSNCWGGNETPTTTSKQWYARTDGFCCAPKVFGKMLTHLHPGWAL